MLINKGFSVNDVITIKLTSGEELIAKLVEDKDNCYLISKPMVLTNAGQGLGMMPYCFTSSQHANIPLNKSSVAVVVLTDKMYSDQYLESTTSIKLS